MAYFKKPRFICTAIIAISIALISVGCLSSGVSSTGKDKWAPPFKGLEWGMSKAEVMDALKLTDDDVETTSYGFKTKKSYNLFGVKEKVVFGFYNGYNDDTLSTITIIYNERDLKRVQKGITKRLGEGEPSYYYGDSFLDKRLSYIEWKSELTKEKPGYEEIITDILVSWGHETELDDLVQQYSERPLVNYQLTLDETSHIYGHLSIEASGELMFKMPELFKKKN